MAEGQYDGKNSVEYQCQAHKHCGYMLGQVRERWRHRYHRQVVAAVECRSAVWKDHIQAQEVHNMEDVEVAPYCVSKSVSTKI